MGIVVRVAMVTVPDGCERVRSGTEKKLFRSNADAGRHDGINSPMIARRME